MIESGKPAVLGPLGGLRVIGRGTALPERRVSNAAVLAGGSASPAQQAYRERALGEALGLRNRHWVHPVGAEPGDDHQTSADLAADAATAALESAGHAASDVGMLLVSTSTPVGWTGTNASILSKRLGIRAPSMDVRAGCAGTLFSMATAALYLGAGVGSVLVVGTDTFSLVCPPEHAVAKLSLGDGAAALLLVAEPEHAVEAAVLDSDGALSGLIATPGTLPPTHLQIDDGAYRLTGDASRLEDVVHERYCQAIEQCLSRAGAGAADIDWFVPHQTNRGLMTRIASSVGIDPERVVSTVDRHANIGNAGWASALVAALDDGRIGAGQRVLVSVVGGGMAWGAALFRGL